MIDRPEQQSDPRWGDTGDRYLLKLFRSYLFHQVEESGEPWIDIAHVVQTLNKLDMGSKERVRLMSPDEKNIMIVTYRDLRHCLNQSFAELSGIHHN